MSNSKILAEQLKKVCFADLSNFNQETNTYLIKKYIKPQYLAGHSYIISIPNHLVNNNNSILSTNWNSGRSPKHSCYKVYINKIVGKMIYVDGLAFDLDKEQDLSDMWSGFLPVDEINQIRKI